MTPGCHDDICRAIQSAASAPMSADSYRDLADRIGLVWRTHEPDRTLEVSTWIDESLPARCLVVELRSWFGAPRCETPALQWLSVGPHYGPPDRLDVEAYQFHLGCSA